jgi:hypothetical protein
MASRVQNRIAASKRKEAAAKAQGDQGERQDDSSVDW